MEISFGKYGPRPQARQVAARPASSAYTMRARPAQAQAQARAQARVRPGWRRGMQMQGFDDFEALRQENKQLRALTQRLATAVQTRNRALKQVMSAQARGTTAARATAASPVAPRAAPAAQRVVPVQPSAPQVLETDRDFTAPTDDALSKAWFGGHLGGSGYDGLDSAGMGIEDALGLDG